MTGGRHSTPTPRPLTPSSPSSTIRSFDGDVEGGGRIPTLQWRQLEREHRAATDALVARLHAAVHDPALHAMTISKLRLAEMTFATNRRRIIQHTVNAMQRSANLRTLTLYTHRWRQFKSQQQRQTRALEEWSEATKEERRRRRMHGAVLRWMEWLHVERGVAVMRARRERRLLRFSVGRWHTALSFCHAQLHLALLLDRRRLHHALRGWFTEWHETSERARRHRQQVQRVEQWTRKRKEDRMRRVVLGWFRWSQREVECRKRLEEWTRERKEEGMRRVLMSWIRWCEREVECRRRVQDVMEASARRPRCRVRPGLLTFKAGITMSSQRMVDDNHQIA